MNYGTVFFLLWSRDESWESGVDGAGRSISDKLGSTEEGEEGKS